MAPLIPKLRVPLEFGTAGFRTVEQDSEDEIAQCVYGLIATPLGSRLEDPELGVEDPTFEQGGPNFSEWQAAAAAFEPRAAALLTSSQLEEGVANVVVQVKAAGA